MERGAGSNILKVSKKYRDVYKSEKIESAERECEEMLIFCRKLVASRAGELMNELNEGKSFQNEPIDRHPSFRAKLEFPLHAEFARLYLLQLSSSAALHRQRRYRRKTCVKASRVYQFSS